MVSVKASDPHATTWKMQFEPGGFAAHNVTLFTLTKEAWKAYAPGQLEGGPGWTDKTHFDIQAKIDPADQDAFEHSDLQARRLLLQETLRRRFHLEVQTVSRNITVLSLTRHDSGTALHLTSDTGEHTTYGSLVTESHPGYVKGQNFSVQQFGQLLQQYTQHIVVDDTHLTARYDFYLRWSSDGLAERASTDNGSSSAGAPPLLTALQEQLGLKLVTKKQSVSVRTIVSASMPDAD